MSYKVIGTISEIGKVEDAGAGRKLKFRIKTDEIGSETMEFEMYKGSEYFEHLDNFSKYNKVGDKVEVEWNLRTYHWEPNGKDKIFTSLSCWKVEKAQVAEYPQATPDPQIGDNKVVDDLPF